MSTAPNLALLRAEIAHARTIAAAHRVLAQAYADAHNPTSAANYAQWAEGLEDSAKRSEQELPEEARHA